MASTQSVVIYTDGASTGNPGPGGYGVVLKAGTHRKELARGYYRTTNNRMELMAVIAGLEALKKPGTDVTIYSDSKYVVDAVEKGWLAGWEKKDFRIKGGGERINTDLWKRLLVLLRQHRVRFRWVKGHAGHAENERCDQLAVQAAQQPETEDVGYT
jgi:ribonuclease HI